MPASDCRDHPCTLGRIALCARAFAPHSGSSANMRGAPVLWCDAPSGSGAAVCVWVADGSYSPWSKLLQGRAWVRRRLSNARFALFWLFCDAAAGALPLTATVPLFCRSRCQVAYFITYDKNIYGTFRELPIVLCRVARVPLPARSARPSARGRGGARARAARHTRAAGVRYGPGAGAPPPDTPTSAQGQIHLIYYRVLQKTNSSSTTPPPAARRKSNWEREQ